MPQNICRVFDSLATSGQHVSRQNIDPEYSYNLIQRIERAFDPLSSLAKHMGVDHSCGHIVMTQKALDGPDISACLQKVRRKRMPEGMGCNALYNTCQFYCPLNGSV